MQSEIVAKVIEPPSVKRPTRYVAMFQSGCFAVGSTLDTAEAAAKYGDPTCTIVKIPGTDELANLTRIEQARQAVIDAAKRLSQADSPDDGAKATRDIDEALQALAAAGKEGK
jgi:hypothetical protein